MKNALTSGYSFVSIVRNVCLTKRLAVSTRLGKNRGACWQMMGDVLTLLKNRLNRYLDILVGGAIEDKVVFMDGDQKTDSVNFKPNAITVLLYRVEQESATRQGDPYIRMSPGGAAQKVQPDMYLNLYVLFVAKFTDYALGLQYLSHVVRYFQSNPVFDRQNSPEMAADIINLSLDFVSLTAQQQNELWGLWRTYYLPSVAYKVRTLTFRDADAALPGPAVAGLERRGLE